MIPAAELARQEVIRSLRDPQDMVLEQRVKDIHVVFVRLSYLDRGRDLGERGFRGRDEQHLARERPAGWLAPVHVWHCNRGFLEEEDIVQVLEDDGVGVEDKHAVELCEVEGQQLGIGIRPCCLFRVVLVQHIYRLDLHVVIGLCLLQEACDGSELLGGGFWVDFLGVPI